ncbi:UPF0158 family protein [Mycobacterium sp.]|uniref:UPF0158 family protein n=1 Tax=Mycobacterium sp. TaxID=1785 RepID=UPI003F981456
MVDWDANAANELHLAVVRGDGSTVVEVVRGRMLHEALQLAGDGLLDAVAQGVPQATELAAQCAAALRERAWTGDEELADQLLAILNQGATPMLRPLPVDLDQLADLLEGDPRQGGGRIDLETGDCWPEMSDYEENQDDEEGRWLYVECEGSRPGYWDMELFIETVDDPAIVDRLEIAIKGKGAFRRFKDVLARWPAELQRYFQLSEERQRGRARAWLAAAGYRPVRQARL